MLMWARKPKNGMGWWYGFKLHVQCDETGCLCAFGVGRTTHRATHALPIHLLCGLLAYSLYKSLIA
jgi:hypothetical protein